MSSLKSFKAALEEEYSFPTEYVFKFIIKSSSKKDVIDQLDNLHDNNDFSSLWRKINLLIWSNLFKVS